VQWLEPNRILVCKWHDKRDVHMLATCAGTGVTKKNVRRQHQMVQIDVPDCVLLYNKYMGGVDHLDQYRAYYSVGRTGKKWWKYLFWSILDITIINSYILRSLRRMPLPANRRKWSLKALNLAMMHQLCDNFSPRCHRFNVASGLESPY